MENVELRFATPADVPLVLQLIEEIAQYEKMEVEVVATAESLNEWMFEKGLAESLLCFVDGDLAGHALFFHNFSSFEGKAGLYLEDIFVREQYRKRGLGKALFQSVAKIACERGCPRMEWCCLDWNKPSIDFYISQGAKPMEGWTTYRLSGEALDAMGE